MHINEIVQQDFKSKHIELLKLQFLLTELMLFQKLSTSILQNESLNKKISQEVKLVITNLSDDIFKFQQALNSALMDCSEQKEKPLKEDEERLNKLILAIPDIEKMNIDYEKVLSDLNASHILSGLPEDEEKKILLHKKSLHKCYRLINRSILFSDAPKKGAWQSELLKLLTGFEIEFNKQYEKDPAILMSSFLQASSDESDTQAKFAELAIGRTRGRPPLDYANRDNELIAAQFETKKGMTKKDLLEKISILYSALGGKDKEKEKDKKSTIKMLSLFNKKDEIAEINAVQNKENGIAACIINPASAILLMEQFLVNYIQANYPDNMIVKTMSNLSVAEIKKG